MLLSNSSHTWSAFVSSTQSIISVCTVFVQSWLMSHEPPQPNRSSPSFWTLLSNHQVRSKWMPNNKRCCLISTRLLVRLFKKKVLVRVMILNVNFAKKNKRCCLISTGTDNDFKCEFLKGYCMLYVVIVIYADFYVDLLIIYNNKFVIWEMLGKFKNLTFEYNADIIWE
jgi:hypothetical protein